MTDFLLEGFTPILTAGIQTTIIPIIEQNLEKLDSIEGDINQKLDELANTAKTGIDSLPEIPFVFTKEIREKIMSELPFDKVDKLLDELDLSAIDKIEIKPEIDKNGEIKAKLTQFPNKIREKLKASIRAAFSPGAVADNTQVAETKEPEAEKETEIKKESIEDGLSNLSNDDKKETIDRIMTMLKDTGILDEIKKRICTPPAPPAPTAGGANKKHRRKTKKNIRRQKRTYTKFGREF